MTMNGGGTQGLKKKPANNNWLGLIPRDIVSQAALDWWKDRLT